MLTQKPARPRWLALLFGSFGSSGSERNLATSVATAGPSEKENIMTPATTRDRAIACGMIAVAVAAFVAVVLFAFAAVAHADTTPVGPLPSGPVSIVSTGPNQLVAVALRIRSR